MPHQPVEDRRRPLRPAASRARRPPPPLKATGAPRARRGRGPANLFVVTGPSGAGKGTLIKALVARRGDLEVAVSATTRARRASEVEGRDYYFLSEDEFAERAAGGEFLEHVVYVSGRYGTLRTEVDRILAAGKSCVLELETQGARAIRDDVPESVTVFVAPPSFAELERRLRERATESSGEVEERLEVARRQIHEAGDFRYTVVNDDVERAVEELDAIVTRELEAVGRLSAT